MRSVNNGKTILLAEDEPEVRNYLEMALRCEGYAVETAQDGEEALYCLQSAPSAISAVLLDIVMPRKDGIETLRGIRNLNKDVPVIMVSGASSPLSIVEAMHNGATDFLGKPVSHEELSKTLQKVLEQEPAGQVQSPPPAASPAANGVFFGADPRMREICALIGPVGWSEAPVLIQGETGTGKEVLARQLHLHSPRALQAFLKLNCAALPSELVESELFGYERGAFTGALQKKPGMFELAHGGTLLLDEIGDMAYKLQAKLLQVLQDQEFQHLGGKETIRVDVRVIAATHNELEQALLAKTFREDLYYRLNVINLRLPPLRERRADILPLAEFLLKRHAPADQLVPELTRSLKQSLTLHDWPGNVRELENLMRKLIVLGNPETIAEELRAKASRPPVAEAPPVRDGAKEIGAAPASPAILDRVTKATQQAETEAILNALNSTHWNRKQAAVLLQIDYKALLYKMKKLSIAARIVSTPA